MRRLLLILAITCLSMSARADLHEIETIDAVAINKTTGEIRLFLVVNWPLEDGQTKRQVQRKLVFYAVAAKSAEFAARYPLAKPDLPIQLEVIHLAKRTELGQSVLTQIDGQAKQLGFVPSFVVAEAGK